MHGAVLISNVANGEMDLIKYIHPVWWVCLVICLAITVSITVSDVSAEPKPQVTSPDVRGSVFLVIFCLGFLWLCALGLAVVFGIIGFIIDKGRGWNWVISAFLIAAICCIINIIVYFLRTLKANKYASSGVMGGALGFFIELAFFLCIVAFSSSVEVGVIRFRESLGNLMFLLNIPMSTRISFIAMPIPIFGIVFGLVCSKHIQKKQRHKRESEERRSIKEQNQRVYDQWEKNEESEINNLLK